MDNSEAKNIFENRLKKRLAKFVNRTITSELISELNIETQKELGAMSVDGLLKKVELPPFEIRHRGDGYIILVWIEEASQI